MNYGYDQASALTGLTYSLAGNVLGNLTYAYDADGRRTQMGGSWARTGMPNPTTSTAVYNAGNQLANWNGATLTYDLNGNLLSDGANAYSWNKRNQLDSISRTTAASFQYGPFGRRLGKTINGATTDFLYDGVNPVQELTGGSPSANLLTGLGVDEYFARTDLTGTSNFLTDALGSTVALADPTGTVQTEYTYAPFGKTTTQGTGNANFFQFTGRENDGDGLYFYRARYYSSTFSRFISQDPAGLAGGGPNLYAYVFGNPTVLIDLSELRPGDRYPNLLCAGWQAIWDFNSESRHRDLEYAGFIYRNPDGSYSYTDPSANGGAGIGTSDSVPNFWNITIPPRTTRAGWFHTHAAYDPRMNSNDNPQPGAPSYDWHRDGNEIFSPNDRQISDTSNLPGFLGTPRGTTEEYTPHGQPKVMSGRPCGCGAH